MPRAIEHSSSSPIEILSQGRAGALIFAWREPEPHVPLAPPPAPVAVVPAPAPDDEDGEGRKGGHAVRISLYPRGTYFDGDRVVGADGVRWERARS